MSTQKILLKWLVAGLFLFSTHSFAFVIEDIRVEGLQRISAGTIFTYMPVQAGDEIDASETGTIIRDLFKTGFFKDVRLEREGNVLIVFVIERPAISSIKITGNESLETDQLIESLKELGLAEGRVFNRSLLSKIEQELKRQFLNSGKYGVELNTTVTPLERNRVAIDIEIEEGETAKIKKINIVGNQAFDNETLLELFSLNSDVGWMEMFSKNNQYSRQKLSGDLETLRSYYLDRGYINFKIDSQQVAITPDKQHIYITINVTEGDVYSISDISLAGDMVIEKEKIFPMIHLVRKEVFSRRLVVGSSERISALLSNHGYAFANVNSIPDVDVENKTVAITFFVDPGKRVYVRRVNVRGNDTTRDEVIRREMRQMETAWFSAEQVSRSKDRLKRLGFFEDIQIETPAVPGSTDQVDVNVKVTEKPAGNLSAGVGFSQSQGVTLSTSITQTNFLGTGKRVSFAFNNSSSNTQYRLAYTNPYYTVDGVSRGFDISYRQRNFDEQGNSNYATDVGLAEMNFGVPINEFDRIHFALGFSHTALKVGTAASTEVTNFKNNNGTSFLDFNIAAGWTHDSRDSYTFPTRGGIQSLNVKATVPGSDLEYYKVAYKHRRYFSLTDDFTLSINADLAFGDSYGNTTILPIFENYYAGGVKSIRGFKDYSLGPRDTNGDPLGGNLKIVGNVELLFPPPFKGAAKSVRLSAFVDGGNVYNTRVNNFDIGDIRYSAGVGAVWLSPVGVLGISLARPFNAANTDDTEFFQFTFGSTF